MQKYIFKVQKCTFKVQNFTFEVPRYTFKVQKCAVKVQKCTFKVQKCTVKVQTYFFNLSALSKCKSILSKYKKFIFNVHRLQISVGVYTRTGLPVGFYLEKTEAGHAGGRTDLAVLGALGWVGRGVWPCWIWLCWARWAGLAWGLAVLGAGLGWAWGFSVLGVGFGFGGRAGVLGADLGFLCMVYLVHVFFMSSWCFCVYLHVYLRCASWVRAKQSLALAELFMD